MVWCAYLRLVDLVMQYAALLYGKPADRQLVRPHNITIYNKLKEPLSKHLNKKNSIARLLKDVAVQL